MINLSLTWTNIRTCQIIAYLRLFLSLLFLSLFLFLSLLFLSLQDYTKFYSIFQQFRDRLDTGEDLKEVKEKICTGWQKDRVGKWFWNAVAAWAGGGTPLMQPDTPLSGSVLRLKQASFRQWESLVRAHLVATIPKVGWIGGSRQGLEGTVS